MKNEEFYKREIIDFALDGYSFGLNGNIITNPPYSMGLEIKLLQSHWF